MSEELMSEKAMLNAFMDDMEKNSRKPIRMTMSVGMAVAIVAHLQLALRHPDNTGGMSESVRKFTEEIIGRASGCEATRKLLNMGFSPVLQIPAVNIEVADDFMARTQHENPQH